MIDETLRQAIEIECNQLEARLFGIEQRLTEIEQAGYTSAHFIKRVGYKGKENLYLSHAMRSIWVQSGKPRMEYVGTKPERVAAAQARIDRYEEKCKLETERSKTRHTLAAVKYHLAQIELVLFGREAYLAHNGR